MLVNECYEGGNDNVWKVTGSPKVKNNQIIVRAKRYFDVKDKQVGLFEKSTARDIYTHSQRHWYVAVFDKERDLVKTSDLMIMTLESGNHL